MIDRVEWESMTLDELLDYIHERDLFYLRMLISIDGFEETCNILAENGKI